MRSLKDIYSIQVEQNEEDKREREQIVEVFGGVLVVSRAHWHYQTDPFYVTQRCFAEGRITYKRRGSDMSVLQENKGQHKVSTANC